MERADWLTRLSARQWLQAALHELSEAKRALRQHATSTAVMHARRAAGMAWNAVLWYDPALLQLGRSYGEHLRALAQDDVAGLPQQVRSAAAFLLDEDLTRTSKLVQLATPGRQQRIVEAAEVLMAEAYARWLRHVGPDADSLAPST